MAEFVGQDLSGARFDDVDLREVSIRNATLRGAQLVGVDLRDVTMKGVELGNVTISGEIYNLVINGVDVAPLVEAELNRRDPERAAMQPIDPAGFAAAWAIVERRWAETIDRARALDPELLHESVNGEWSFIETLRHLVFATDAWIRRGILGDPAPWHPLGLPWDEAPKDAGLPGDRTLRPSLGAVLTIRQNRMAGVRSLIEGLTQDSLDAMTEPVRAPGWPPPESFAVRECLLVVLNEEYLHRQFAERDLDILAPTG